MAPQTPLLLVDNVYDTINLYPAATLSDTSEITGREGFRVADARRERSWWQPAGDATVGIGNWIESDLGAGNSLAPDYVWLDRGHNLAGKTLNVESSPDNSSWTTIASFVVPAAGTVGGDPTVGLSATEEGACYALFTAGTARRYLRVRVSYVASFVAVIPGLMLGKRTQLLGFSRVRDEDAGNRTEVQETSRSGYLGTDKRYDWRTFALDLNYIGASEYDGTIRKVVRDWMFTRDQPFVGIVDYGTYPERAWLYRWDGTQFSAQMNRVYRGLQIRGREVGPLLR